MNTLDPETDGKHASFNNLNTNASSSSLTQQKGMQFTGVQYTGNIAQIGNEAHMTPLLSAVSCEEDRALVLDVLAAIKACRHPEQLCVSWSVSPVTGGYMITAYLPPPSSSKGSTMEITHDDLGMIESVNLLRVRAGVAHLTQDSWGLKIRITGHKSPVSYTTYDTLRFTQRRFSLWGGLASTVPALTSLAGRGASTIGDLVNGGKGGGGSSSVASTGKRTREES